MKSVSANGLRCLVFKTYRDPNNCFRYIEATTLFEEWAKKHSNFVVHEVQYIVPEKDAFEHIFVVYSEG